jgi:hypothetical protein
MAVLTLYDADPATGTVLPALTAAAAGGDSVANDGRTALEVLNGSGGSLTVTVAAVNPCNFGVVHAQAFPIAAGERRLLGPFRVDRFGTNLAITYSGVTSLTIAARRVP